MINRLYVTLETCDLHKSQVPSGQVDSPLRIRPVSRQAPVELRRLVYQIDSQGNPSAVPSPVY